MKKITADDLIDALNDVDPELYINEEPGAHKKKAKILRLSLLFAAVIAAAALIVIPILAYRAPETPGTPDTTEQPSTHTPTPTEQPTQTTASTQTATPSTTETPSETLTPEPLPLVEGDRVTENGMTFEVNADCVSYTLVALESSITDVSVPADVNGYPVTAIGPVFGHDETGRWTMSIPGSVNYINTAAFRFPCSSIKITVSEDNPYFRMENGCLVDSNGRLMRASEDFTLPDGITSIGDYAFYSLYGMTSLTLPEGIVSIDEEAFYDCGDLETLSLPSTLQSIGNNAFALCTELKTVSAASVENYESISFGAGASDPAAIAGKLYVDGSEAQLDTHEPDRATDEQAWANWLYNDSRAGFAYKLLSYGLQMTNDYYKNKVKLYDGCGWEYWYGLFYFGYNMGADTEPFTVDIGEPEYAYTWEILYRESGKGDFRSILTKPVSVYYWGDGRVIFRIPTYKEGMKNLKADCTYDFLFVIHEGDEQGEIKAFYRDEILVTQAYTAYLSDAIRGDAFKDGGHEHSLVVLSERMPTCTSYGYTRNVRCRTCGQTIEKTELIRPLGHCFVNGICTRCGAESRGEKIPIKSEEDLEHVDIHIDGAQHLPGVVAGDLLHEGTTEPSPIEFNKSIKSYPTQGSDKRRTLWLRVIIDKTEFDPKRLFPTHGDYEELSLRFVFTDKDGTAVIWTPDPRMSSIVLTDIDERYALLRIALFTEFFGSGCTIFTDSAASGEYTAYLCFGKFGKTDPITRNQIFEVEYYGKFSFALTDSAEEYIHDFFYNCYTIHFKGYHTHTPEERVVSEPLCETEGDVEIVCQTCGVLIGKTSLPALGHEYVDGRCRDCGACENHHVVIDRLVEPTCTESGLTEGSHCDVCGKVLVEQKELPAMGHFFERGVCVRCGVSKAEDEYWWYNWLFSEEMPFEERFKYRIRNFDSSAWERSEDGPFVSKCPCVYDKEKGIFVYRFTTYDADFSPDPILEHPEEYEVLIYYHTNINDPYKLVVTDFSEIVTGWKDENGYDRTTWGIETYKAGVTDLNAFDQVDLVILIVNKYHGLLRYFNERWELDFSYDLALKEAIDDGLFNNA